MFVTSLYDKMHTTQKLIHRMCLLSFYMLKYDNNNKEGIFISVKTVEQHIQPVLLLHVFL
jgi:hypothetical protein